MCQLGTRLERVVKPISLSMKTLGEIISIPYWTMASQEHCTQDLHRSLIMTDYNISTSDIQSLRGKHRIITERVDSST